MDQPATTSFGSPDSSAARSTPATSGVIRDSHLFSNDVVRRQAEHGARFRIEQVTTDALTRNQARAIEQLIIENNRAGFENIRNSISPESEFYDDAVTWAIDYVQKNGIKIGY